MLVDPQSSPATDAHREDSSTPPKRSDESVPNSHATGFSDGSISLVDALLLEQQSLSAVEQFAHQHDASSQHNFVSPVSRYERLLPIKPPENGQQYAFQVDLDRCSGCKSCVTACHSLNGLGEDETWRDVGLLVGGTRANPVVQHVTTACHHCLEPGCMVACPVNAYEKDPVTGIVKHLDDQCFGCQYCTLACPYDVPKYQPSKGIVRKCDMCSERLSAGEAPACVQSCPHEAIRIEVVDKQLVIEEAEAAHFLPAAPDPQLTLPTTHFKTSRVFPRNMLPADYHAVNPQHPHWPLVIMLVLTQMSVGAFVVGQVLEQLLSASAAVQFRRLHATSALVVGLLALLASTLHLGRPQYAFRAVVGLKHSWLSREIVAFGLFATTAIVFAGSCWWTDDRRILEPLSYAVVVSGILGIFCSVMIYFVTGREFWGFRATSAKFVLTSAVLGICSAWCSILVFEFLGSNGQTNAMQLSQQAGKPLLQSLLVAMALKLLTELSLFRHLLPRRNSPLKRSASLLAGPLSASMLGRIACGLLGGIVMPLFVWSNLQTANVNGVFFAVSVALLFAACFTGEMVERYQFFAACASARMPGQLK